MHELRRGELAHFKLIPYTHYYGTADAAILYLIVLHNAWRCTGDPDLLARDMPVAEKCLTWIDKYGDRDGDGFQEYQTRSKAGAYNQGWRDSGQALVNPDGSIVTTPSRSRRSRATFMMHGCAWLRSTTPWANQLVPRLCVKRPRPCSSTSTTRSCMKSPASTLSVSMATKSRY